MNVAAHQEKDEKTGKKENGRPLSKRLRAALLWSIRGQHGEKGPQILLAPLFLEVAVVGFRVSFFQVFFIY